MTASHPTDHILWHGDPAGDWNSALPLGNGRLGAMCFGGVVRDEFQLNEDTLWSGGPYSPVNPEALPHLEEVRALLFAGRYREAHDLADRHMMGRPYLQTAYQPAGRLLLDFDNSTLYSDYRRTLDLQNALHETRYMADGVRVVRESFTSAADHVLVICISADRPGALNFVAEFVSEQPGTVDANAASLRYTGTNRREIGIPGALRWCLDSRLILDGGTSQRDGATLVVTGATTATFLIDIETSFRRFDDVSGDPETLAAQRLDAAAALSYEALRTRHIAAHRALYDRLDIDLGHTAAAADAIGERIRNFERGNDPDLAALYVRYGRYLAISSSRPGTQPANLQGIWNKEMRPPWGSKYTSNINLEMNYWLADPANLAECFEPFIALVEDLAQSGQALARGHYGARGWMLHHNTDLWRATAPVDGAQWGLWPTGGAWVSAQLWDHVRYAGYPKALVERVYPLLVGASQFFVDTLVPLPGSELLVTAPSVSPENMHPHGTTLCYGPAMDNQLVRDLFDATISAATRLGRDSELVTELERLRARLPADRIGKEGQLQEWLEDWDMEAPEIHHRHVSHLYAVYPSLQIDTVHNPELAAAARRSLEIRGDDATGWGIGWRINLWARLRDGNHAHDVLKLLLHPARSYPNLFDAHPPFQIDGNFGGAAGVLEMLVQSDEASITLLPALPDAWPSGQLSGVRARGGVTLDFSWENRRITRLVVTCDVPYPGTVLGAGVPLATGLPLGRTTLV
jgi:alpha-L-fucosidase 2